MKEKTKLEKILDRLYDAYDGKIPRENLKYFAQDIYSEYFAIPSEFGDIFSVIYENEYDLKIADCDSEAYWIIYCIMQELDNNADTAHRLYNLFEWYDDFNVFRKLYQDNREWLTEEEIIFVKKKAWQTFDNEMMMEMGYDFSDIE